MAFPILVPILGAVVLGGTFWVASRPKPARRKKKKSVTPGPKPSRPPREDEPAPEPDDEETFGLEIERIEGIYSFARIYERDDGQFRVNMTFEPPPSQVGATMTLEINEIVPSLDEAMGRADALLYAYGGPPETPNDLIVLLYEHGDARFSVWKHAQKGTFHAVTIHPNGFATLGPFNDPKKALQGAIDRRQCTRKGGHWVQGVGCVGG